MVIQFDCKMNYLPLDYLRDHTDGSSAPAVHQPSYLSLVLLCEEQNQPKFYSATRNFQEGYYERHPLIPVLFQSHTEIQLSSAQAVERR